MKRAAAWLASTGLMIGGCGAAWKPPGHWVDVPGAAAFDGAARSEEAVAAKQAALDLGCPAESVRVDRA
jgi:hypothetical protein